MRFLGFPLTRYIDINDSEEVFRAIQMTDDEVPLDHGSRHSRRIGSAAPQIAQAARDHKSKVTVFVPHYAMSGGTLVGWDCCGARSHPIAGKRWRKSSQPGHGRMVIRFEPQRRRSSVCQFAPTSRTRSSNSCRSTRSPCARKAAAGSSTGRRADKRKPERNAFGGRHDPVGRRKEGRR
jgi:hypothetical protein